jgi:hypothetical protein
VSAPDPAAEGVTLGVGPVAAGRIAAHAAAPERLDYDVCIDGAPVEAFGSDGAAALMAAARYRRVGWTDPGDELYHPDVVTVLVSVVEAPPASRTEAARAHRSAVELAAALAGELQAARRADELRGRADAQRAWVEGGGCSALVYPDYMGDPMRACSKRASRERDGHPVCGVHARSRQFVPVGS